MTNPQTAQNRPILVTGAAGFIGSHVALNLLQRGQHVVAVDNLNDYYDPQRKRQNLSEIRAQNKRGTAFDFHEADIRDAQRMQELFSKHSFQSVIHLAAMAGVRASMENPELYYDVNLAGTLQLLELARRHGPMHFVFASTSSVYGNSQIIPFDETDRADQPLAPYPASKRAAEMLGYSYYHLYGQTFTALRFFTVYGPRGRPDMLAYRVLDNIFLGSDVPLYDRGNMQRDWTYVDDIVAGVVAAADRPAGFAILNLGRGEPVLVSEFIAHIERVTGRKAKLRDEAAHRADVPYTFARIDRAKELLGYAPKVSVKEGVERLWQWYERAVLQGGTPGNAAGVQRR